MDKDKVIATIKEKVNLPEGVAEKVGELLDGKSLVGHVNNDELVKNLTEKLKIDEQKANEVYNAIAEAFSSGAVDKVRAFFKK